MADSAGNTNSDWDVTPLSVVDALNDLRLRIERVERLAELMSQCPEVDVARPVFALLADNAGELVGQVDYIGRSVRRLRNN